MRAVLWAASTITNRWASGEKRLQKRSSAKLVSMKSHNRLWDFTKSWKELMHGSRCLPAERFGADEMFFETIRPPAAMVFSCFCCEPSKRSCWPGIPGSTVACCTSAMSMISYCTLHATAWTKSHSMITYRPTSSTYHISESSYWDFQWSDLSQRNYYTGRWPSNKDPETI